MPRSLLRSRWLSPSLVGGVVLVSLSTLGACGQGSGADEPCGVIEHEPEPEVFETVRVVNSTDGPLWLPAAPCGDSFEVATQTRVRFDMTVDGVEAVDVAPYCARCASGCAQVDNQHCCEGPGACVGTIRIGAGESYDLSWQTYVYPKVEVPVGCNDGQCEEQECRVGRQVAEGASVTMRLQAVAACEDPEGCGDCAEGETCELTSSSACEASSADMVSAEVSFELTSSLEVIELVFE